jgi:DNA-directed RNA polymerase specialized sigma24 family protein
MSANVQIFSGHRDRLFGIAYRMLGSRADAEDVLQDAWLRWHEQDASELRSTEAWLTTMVTRLAIDKLRAAKTQRATYFGPWLPEPLAETEVALNRSYSSIKLRLLGHEVFRSNGDKERAERMLLEINALAERRGGYAYRNPANLVALGRAALLLGAVMVLLWLPFTLTLPLLGWRERVGNLPVYGIMALLLICGDEYSTKDMDS